MNRLSFLAYSAMFGVALVPSSVLAQQQGTTLRQQLIGTWEIVSTSPENRPGAQILGTNPKGVFMLGGSGKYAVTFENRNRPKTAERSAAGFVANFGTWSVNEADKTLAMHVEGSLTPSIEGTEGKRTISLNGDELKVTNPETKITIVYRRVRASN